MSIFTSLLGNYGLEHAFRDKDCTTPAMKAAIGEWFALYYDREATAESDPCQRIAYTVVNKLTKTCFSEYTATSKDEFAQGVLDALNKGKEEVFQTLLIGGETFVKPVPVNGGWKFNAVRRDSMLVFGRDVFGVPNDIGTIERSAQGRYFYTLLERRRVEPDGRLTITNTLYRADEPDQLGSKTTLQALPQYADLAPEYTYPTPLGGIGLVHMRVPTENTVDGSEDGVSVFAPAVGLIHNIDRNEAQINGEFERGKSKVFASADLMRRGPDGKLRFSEDVFVGLDDAPDEVGVTVFSPELRVAAYHERKREYLRNVESLIGIKRGLLSEVEAAERTAKEITSSEGDYNLTITQLQEVWRKAVFDTVKLCGLLGPMYSVAGSHDVADDAVVIDFGNGVLYDEEKVWSDYQYMVSAGLIKPEIALGWRFNMPTDTEADLAKIREKYMPRVDVDGGGEA